MSCFTSLGYGSAIQRADPTRISCAGSLRTMPGANSAGPLNPASPLSPIPDNALPTTFSHGANTSAKAFATPRLGSIPESGVTRNSHSELVIKPAGPSGFLKPFVTAQYRYN